MLLNVFDIYGIIHNLNLQILRYNAKQIIQVFAIDGAVMQVGSPSNRAILFTKQRDRLSRHA